MSLNYIPMSTPDVASIRKEILVNIEDPIQNRSLLDPDVDGNEETVNNDDQGERLMDPDAQDYTGADIYRAKMMAETHYMDPSDLYYNNSHDITNLSSGDNNPSLFGKEESTDQESLLDTDNDDFNYVPKEVYGAISYPSDHDEYYNESAMKAAERNALDDSEFGLPRLRKYPLNDKKHVKFAIRMFGHCKDPKDRAELAKRIFAKIKEFDMDVTIGKGNPLYEYAPKSLQESFATLSAEVPGIVSEEQFDKGTEKERQIRNLQIAARTANVLNFQPALGKAIANLKEYSFLEYFYPDVKSTAFSIRLLTCLGGLATNDMIWKLYGLRPPLCVDNTQPLTHPNKLSPEEFEDKVIPWFRKQANWYHEGKAEDSIHIEYCLSLYSVLGVILLNPEFSMDNLDDYWMGVLTDWLNHVQTEYDELSASVNSTNEFYHRQYLYDLCWNPTENPMDEAIVTRNIINFASTMVSQKMKVDLNEAGGDLLNKDKCNAYIINQLDPEVVDNIYLLPDKMEYPILNQDSIRMAMDMIREVDETDRAKYARMLNKKYMEFGCTFSISIDHPYAEYADQNIIDHMTRVLSEGDTVVDDQGTSDAGPSPDQAPWYVRSDVNGNVGQNLLQNKELGPNDKKNTALNIDPTEPIIV